MAKRAKPKGEQKPRGAPADVDAGAVDEIEIEEKYELPQIDLDFNGNQVSVTRLMLTPELVAVAIYEARGKVSIAARKLNTTVRVVNSFIRNFAICATAVEESEELLLDFVEAKLMQKIKAGDIASIIFYLRTKGKHRGWTEKETQDAAKDAERREQMQQEAKERQVLLSERLDLIGDRIRGALSIEAPEVEGEWEQVDGDERGSGADQQARPA